MGFKNDALFLLVGLLISMLMLCACASSTSIDSANGTAAESEKSELASTGSNDAERVASEKPLPNDTISSDSKEEIDPTTMLAGTMITDEMIQRGGGVDSFFWSEEISPEVFNRMDGLSYGKDCTIPLSDLRYIRVLHVDAEGKTFVGELVVNRRVSDEVVDIFRDLYEARYPIRKMHLVDDYGADDAASCIDDNTSSFNYRPIAGTSQLSNHSYGLAIDINTYENPYYIVSTGYLWPPEGEEYLNRSLEEPYMIHQTDLCYRLFTENGWTWGGQWNDPKDYQHFEKPQALFE